METVIRVAKRRQALAWDASPRDSGRRLHRAAKWRHERITPAVASRLEISISFSSWDLRPRLTHTTATRFRLAYNNQGVAQEFSKRDGFGQRPYSRACMGFDFGLQPMNPISTLIPGALPGCCTQVITAKRWQHVAVSVSSWYAVGKE